MRSLSGLEIGLSFVSGIIFLGFVAEVYHFLWWKRRLTNPAAITDIDDGSKNNYTPLFSYFFCWRTPNSMSVNNPHRVEETEEQEDLEMSNNSTDALLKGMGGEENVDIAELMRLHNLWGPPRFLFTIKEETKEDLDDAKSRGDRSRKGSRTRSLSDVFSSCDTPFLTPLASPTIKSSLHLEGYNHHRGVINPLFEACNAEFDLFKLRSSPPPRFKFLRDAEEKLLKRLVEESERRKAIKDGVSD